MTSIAVPRMIRSAGRFRMAAALALLVASGCHSLEVTNPNDPDRQRALATGGDVQSLLGGAFRKWYFSMADMTPAAILDVASDHYEAYYANVGLSTLGWEPRIYGLVNLHTDPTFQVDIEEPWYNNYGALVSANLVINALGNGVKVPGPADSSANPMILAAARFMQGASLANIALVFDSGYAFDETYDPTGPALPLVGRDSVQRAALAKLDAAISLASAAGANWSIPESFLNQPGYAWTNAQLAQAANTWAARTIAYFPHDVAENAVANWAKVVSYASNGISSGTPFDLASTGDGAANWYDDAKGISTAFLDWVRVHYRVLCLLDPTFKCHKANNPGQDSILQSPDYRFNGDDVAGHNCVPQAAAEAAVAYGAYCPGGAYGGADFIYAYADPIWPSSRGNYRLSSVGYVRYFDYGWDSPNYALGKSAFVMAAENDLLWAEGLVRSGGSFASAATKINKTRVTRGHLPPVTGAMAAAELLAAITYERGIELFGSAPLVPWYDQRRLGPDLNPHYYTAPNDSDQTGWLPYGQGLQPLTPRLLPVPQQELTLIGHNVYTYGGPGNPEPTAAARPTGVFGTTRDGRVILGPGRWAAIADSMIAANMRNHRSLSRM